MIKGAKRAIGLILALVMALGVGGNAFAAEYKTYGDGSVKSFVLTDANGYTKTYFDIYGGATTRDDTSDAPGFLRKALSSEESTARFSQSQGYLWNNLARHIVYNDKTLLDGKSFGEAADAILGLKKHGSFGGATLIEASGLKGVEAGIRKTLSAYVNAADKNFSTTPEYFAANKELSDSNVGGVAFYTQTGYWGGLDSTGLDKTPLVVALGAIYYDFKLSFVNTPDALDSAVGKETDIKKLEGRRGFTHTTGAGTDNYTYKLTNDTPDSVTQTQQMTKGSTLTTGSTVSSTKTYGFSEMIGVDVKMGFKIPFIGSSEQTFKTSFTASQTIGSTESSSLTKAEQLSVASSVQVKLPPYTQGVVEQVNTVDAVTIEYDYPVAVSYKTAVYALYSYGKNDTAFSVIARFGRDGDSKNVTSADNLFNRFRFRDTPGYEDSHGDGLDWKAIIAGDSSKKDIIAAISEYVPMSVTGGVISYSADCVEGVANKPVPLYPLTRVVLSGEDYYDMNPGDKLNVAGLKLTGYCDKAKTVPYSDFSAENGSWRLVDENLRPIEQSEVASLSVNPVTGRTLLVAGEKPGTVYLQYLIDEDCYTYAGNLGPFTKNSDLEATGIVEICVSIAPNDFAGSVEVAGAVEGRAGTSVDLNASELLSVTVRDDKGEIIANPKYPIRWAAPENTVGIALEANQLDLNAAGNYTIIAYYLGVPSNPVAVKVRESGLPVTGLRLNVSERTLEVGESARLEAFIEPENAEDSLVNWRSEDESVATVDQSGLVVGVKPGKCLIMAASRDGGFSASCAITVSDGAVSGKLKPFMEKLALKKGASFKLTPPAGLLGSWSVADESIATITGKGAVKAKKTGETELTFTVGEGKGEFLGKSLLVGDKVTIPLAVRDKGFVVTKLSVTPAKPVIGVGEVLALEVTLKPAKAVDREIYYRSDDESVVVIDALGNIRGVALGAASITAVSPSGAVKTVPIVVTDEIRSLALSSAKLKLKVGDTHKLSYSYAPASLSAPTLVWSSAKPAIATVDESGLITALKKGKTTIVAATPSGVKATCKVTVK